VATAVAEALVEHGILTGERVNEIIAVAMAPEALKAQTESGAQWGNVKVSAASFVAGLEG
jgi:hypothetical protein